MAELTTYEQSAHGRWAAHVNHTTMVDNPSINVWYPRSIPWARLATASSFSGPERLPDGPIHAYLTIAGVQIGGTLDDLELLLAAATESLADVRRYANELRPALPKEET